MDKSQTLYSDTPEKSSITITQSCINLNELPKFFILQGLICKTDFLIHVIK